MAVILDTGRPRADEYAPYYETYVGLVEETAIDAVLRAQVDIVSVLVDGLSEAQADHRYAPGKWSLREVIGHVIDAEWVFSSRAFWFARSSSAPLPGMDQDEFAAAAKYADVPLTDLRDQFVHARMAGLSQYRSFPVEVLQRRGRASDCEFSVRGLLFILAGHVRHHLRLIESRYLAPS